MDPNLRQTYLAELVDRILDFSAVWPQFLKACEEFDKRSVSADQGRVNRWRVRKFAADVLQTAAQIGRILDPQPMRGTDEFRAGCRARGEALRVELRVPPDSPLLERGLRNALEHIDEHIDRWVAENPVRPLETWAFTTTAAGDAPLEGAIRRIHVRTHDVFVLGECANLDRIHDAVETLARALPAVQRTEMLLRFDDPSTGASDVIAVNRVLNAGERIPDPEPPRK
jgi:hypothetical protein